MLLFILLLVIVLIMLETIVISVAAFVGELMNISVNYGLIACITFAAWLIYVFINIGIYIGFSRIEEQKNKRIRKRVYSRE